MNMSIGSAPGVLPGASGASSTAVGVSDSGHHGAAPSGAARPATEAAPPTLLVVDDEPGIVDSLQKIFEREQLRVLTATTGAEALEIVRREPVSVLITDLMMSGMSGLDLLKA